MTGDADARRSYADDSQVLCILAPYRGCVAQSCVCSRVKNPSRKNGKGHNNNPSLDKLYYTEARRACMGRNVYRNGVCVCPTQAVAMRPSSRPTDYDSTPTIMAGEHVSKVAAAAKVINNDVPSLKVVAEAGIGRATARRAGEACVQSVILSALR